MENLKSAIRGMTKLSYKSPALKGIFMAYIMFESVLRKSIISNTITEQSYMYLKLISAVIFYGSLLVLLFMNRENQQKFLEDEDCIFAYRLWVCIVLFALFIVIRGIF